MSHRGHRENRETQRTSLRESLAEGLTLRTEPGYFPVMPRPAPAPSTRATARTSAVAADTESSLRFSVTNLAIMAAGLAAIVVGYMLLASGSTVAAPLLLVLGYAVLIPLGIIW